MANLILKMNVLLSLMKLIIVFSVLFVVWVTGEPIIDKPCAARQANNSIICVCNATYCDEITRLPPIDGYYVTYASSQSGSRFEKFVDVLDNSQDENAETTLRLKPDKLNQRIIGFGAAITDSAALNWFTLSNRLVKQYFIDSYFSKRGLEYNMLRVPIGGCDFSTHQYAYNELPENDDFLTNYSLSFEDIHYKIPMIRSCFKASNAPVYIIGTTWSPPHWMKEKTNYSSCGRLKERFFPTYADYHYKFIEEYDRFEIPVWAITTTNEPAHGYIPVKKFNCLGWSAHRLGLWISNYLGPMLRGSRFSNVKILAVDDQRYTLTLWYSEMLEEHPMAARYIDGVALHYYGDKKSPPQLLMIVSHLHPDKFLIATEACEGAFNIDYPKVILGSWDRAQAYALDILEDLNFNVTGWLDWNICLNEQGGPTWIRNFVDSPVIIAATKGEFYKQPMFYVMGHFSKFLPRDSVRIDVDIVRKNEKDLDISYVAFLTPEKSIVVVIYNKGKDTTVGLQIYDKQVTLYIESRSIVTLETLIQDE